MTVKDIIEQVRAIHPKFDLTTSIYVEEPWPTPDNMVLTSVFETTASGVKHDPREACDENGYVHLDKFDDLNVLVYSTYVSLESDTVHVTIETSRVKE